MPEFNQEQFLATANKKTEEFAQHKSGKQGWKPPPGEYTVELVDVRLLQFDREGVSVCGWCPKFQLHDGEHAGKKFDTMFSTTDRGTEVLSRQLAAIFGPENPIPDELGVAMVKSLEMVGNFYLVAVKAPRSEGYAPSVYVNRFIGRGQQVTA